MDIIPLQTFPDFWHYAEDARLKFDAFFGNPAAHGPEHRVFDYWFVPNLYTYLRADPDAILGAELTSNLVHHLQLKFPGMQVLKPWLHLYVAGCRQEIHNDSENGVYAFVLSLTRQKTFTGGQTCIAKIARFSEIEPRRPDAFEGFFSVVEPNFNQLVVFDDRLPHFVPVVQGSMNPLEGRVVLTGHIRE